MRADKHMFALMGLRTVRTKEGSPDPPAVAMRGDVLLGMATESGRDWKFHPVKEGDFSMAQHLGSDGRFRINAPTVSHETIEDETLIIDLESGDYYSLLGVGADIWLLTDRGATVGTIVDVINEHYHGPRGEIEFAVTKFLTELQKEKLIVQVQGDERQADADVDIRLGTGTGRKGRAFEAPVLTKHTDMQDLLLLCPVHDVDESVWPTPKTPVED